MGPINNFEEVRKFWSTYFVLKNGKRFGTRTKRSNVLQSAYMKSLLEMTPAILKPHLGDLENKDSVRDAYVWKLMSVVSALTEFDLFATCQQFYQHITTSQKTQKKT